MRKLISGAMAIAAIGALTAPAYAADATKSGAVEVTEQPSTVASHDLKITTTGVHKGTSSGKFTTAAGKIEPSSKLKMTKSADHKGNQAIPNKSDYLK
jgi:hypothetical protein